MIESPLVVCYVRYVHVISMQIFLFFFFTESFKSFVCYNMSVYPIDGNKVAAPYSIQTYIQEKSMYLKPIM